MHERIKIAAGLLGLAILSFSVVMLQAARNAFHEISYQELVLTETQADILKRECGLRWPLKAERYEVCLEGKDNYHGQ